MEPQLNRRHILALGGGIATALVGSTALSARTAQTSSDLSSFWKPIENIVQAEGMYSDGVFSIEIDREDITDVTLNGVPIKPSFELSGSLYFQRLSEETVILNGDMALKPAEVDLFIDKLLAGGITFQALHQHFYDFNPPVWFIHFRKTGEPTAIALAVKAALDVTSTPFPQVLPSNPVTPLPAAAIGKILGASPNIGSDGVVTYDVPREDRIILGDVFINPYLNVSTSIGFQPLNGAAKAAAAPDFGMVASEINPVVRIMRQQGWDIGCLYNQETAEYPQLYFSHQFKTGDPIQLAHEIRNGLNLMDVKFK